MTITRSLQHPTAEAPVVQSVSEARSGLPGQLRRFREGDDAPVLIGSHRAPEAVLMSLRRYERLRRESESAAAQPPTVDGIREYRIVIEQLARANRLVPGGVRVFGSVARGEAGPDSDVDVLVTPGPDASLLDLAAFEQALEALLGRRVDVISERALDPMRDQGILTDAVPL